MAHAHPVRYVGGRQTSVVLADAERQLRARALPSKVDARRNEEGLAATGVALIHETCLGCVV